MFVPRSAAAEKHQVFSSVVFDAMTFSWRDRDGVSWSDSARLISDDAIGSESQPVRSLLPGTAFELPYFDEQAVRESSIRLS